MGAFEIGHEAGVGSDFWVASSDRFVLPLGLTFSLFPTVGYLSGGDSDRGGEFSSASSRGSFLETFNVLRTTAAVGSGVTVAFCFHSSFIGYPSATWSFSEIASIRSVYPGQPW